MQGAGPWSDPLEIISGAGSPDTVTAPKVTNKASHSVLVSWSEPLNNGSAITEYRVQMATPYLPPVPPTELPPNPTHPSLSPTPTPPLSPTESEPPSEDIIPSTQDLSHTHEPEPRSPTTEEPPQTEKTTTVSSISTPEPQPTSFQQVYQGSGTCCEVKGLQPASIYLFRVQVRILSI